MNKTGPFGMWMGMKLDELNVTYKKKCSNHYFLDDVPKPHPEFTSYAVFITRTYGISEIDAGTEPIRTDRYGSELKLKFDKLRTRLNSVYGPSVIFDHIESDSEWKKPSEWMLSLDHQDRFLSATWTKDKGAMLKNSLVKVHLSVNSLDGINGFLALLYTFENHQQARNDLNRLSNSIGVDEEKRRPEDEFL